MEFLGIGLIIDKPQIEVVKHVSNILLNKAVNKVLDLVFLNISSRKLSIQTDLLFLEFEITLSTLNEVTLFMISYWSFTLIC